LPGSLSSVAWEGPRRARLRSPTGRPRLDIANATTDTRSNSRSTALGWRSDQNLGCRQRRDRLDFREALAMACAGHGVGHTGQLRGVDLHELRRSCLTGPASSVGRDDIEGLFGHDVTGPGPAGPSGSALGLGKLAFGSGRGGTHTAMSTNYDLDIVGRVRRASGDIPQSVDDLYLITDVQGVVEGLRGGLGEVHATV
jgi:hypothetical protein